MSRRLASRAWASSTHVSGKLAVAAVSFRYRRRPTFVQTGPVPYVLVDDPATLSTRVAIWAAVSWSGGTRAEESFACRHRGSRRRAVRTPEVPLLIGSSMSCQNPFARFVCSLILAAVLVMSSWRIRPASASGLVPQPCGGLAASGPPIFVGGPSS